MRILACVAHYPKHRVKPGQTPHRPPDHADSHLRLPSRNDIDGAPGAVEPGELHCIDTEESHIEIVRVILPQKLLESWDFDIRLIRPSPSKFRRRDIADGTVRTVFIVIQSPRLELGSGIGQREENIDVETLISESPVEALNEAIIDGFSRSNEVQLDVIAVCPGIHGLGNELAAIIDSNRFR